MHGHMTPALLPIYLLLATPAVAAEPSPAQPVSVETRETRVGGVYLSLTQILPDQVRAFYLGRGFDPDSAELLATRACVFQTVFRNEAVASGIAFDLAEWRARTPTGDVPLKLEREWQREWEQRGVSSGARTAFRYALFPTEHHYAVGDWNMGMTTYTLPLGSRFDLKFVWHEGDKQREAVISDVHCATDTIHK